MKYAVKAIWLIWLIAWSGRLMATISIHASNIGMKMFEFFHSFHCSKNSTFDRVDKKVLCEQTHTHTHDSPNWIYRNVFNVLCIFAYYLWSSIFETSVICDVMLSFAFPFNVNVWACVFFFCTFHICFLCSAFHSFWLVNIRKLYSSNNIFSFAVDWHTLTHSMYIYY